MRKITFNNFIRFFLIVIILFHVYKYTSEYFIIKSYQYGKKYNSVRLENGIPTIDDKMEPFKMPVDNNWGMIWVNEKQTSKQKPLIHRIKIINATEKEGWKSESDSYFYFINDTTNYILSIESIKLNYEVGFKYKLKKTDSRKSKFKDYLEEKYENYPERKLEKKEADSLMRKWKIK